MYVIVEYDDATNDPETDLISLDDLKLALGITDNSQDDELQDDIARYSALITEFMGRRYAFGYALQTFRYDPGEVSRPAAPLCLALRPVAAIESVILNDTALAEGVDYTLDATKGFVRLTGGVWSGTVAITYAGGFDLPDYAPAYLSTAIIESIRLQQMADTRGDTSVSAVVHGDTRVSYFQGADASSNSSGLASSVVDLLRPFRAPTVA